MCELISKAGDKRVLRIRKLARWTKGVYEVQKGWAFGRKTEEGIKMSMVADTNMHRGIQANMRSPEPDFAFTILSWHRELKAKEKWKIYPFECRVPKNSKKT